MARSRGKSFLLRGAFVALALAALLAAPGAIHGTLVHYHRDIEHRPMRGQPGADFYKLPQASPGTSVRVDTHVPNRTEVRGTEV